MIFFFFVILLSPYLYLYISSNQIFVYLYFHLKKNRLLPKNSDPSPPFG